MSFATNLSGAETLKMESSPRAGKSVATLTVEDIVASGTSMGADVGHQRLLVCSVTLGMLTAITP
jgi:hypothetical protein